MNEREKNFQERIWFIKYWADYMKKNPVEKWSEQQAQFLDSQEGKADAFYKRLEKTEEGRKILERLKKERLGISSA